MIIDAKDLIVGRLGAFVAKQTLLGEKIDIVNSELAVVSGTKAVILKRFKQRADRGTPAKGPHYIRSADRLLKRMIRDMLPYKNERGKTAFKNIKCWKGIPPQFEGKDFKTVPGAVVSKLPNYKYLSLKDIVRFLGGKLE